MSVTNKSKKYTFDTKNVRVVHTKCAVIIESMFKEFMEAMNERFHQDKPMREGSKVTNDSLASSVRNNREE